MDKIFASNDDFIKIINWSDAHEECHLKLKEIPLKAFKLVCEGYVTKYILDGVKVKASIRCGDKPIMTTEALLQLFSDDDRCLRTPYVINTEPSDFISKTMPDEITKLAISVFKQYTAIMTFMAYGCNDHKVEYELAPQQPTQTSTHSNGKRKQKKRGTTYLFQKRQYISRGGHHASPSYEFSVRGHYRHYKNGKTIWVAQYQKGIGKHKYKNYKFKKEL